MRTSTKSIIVLLCIFCSTITSAQYIEIGASIGFATYQGDINPLSSRLSIQGARFAKGLSLGYNFNKYFAVKARFMDSYLEANDGFTQSGDRQARGLHFRTDLKEYSLSFETELLNSVPWFNKRNLKPYFSVGLGLFKFNPQAKLNGVWHELQPLGTEGQGLPGSNVGKYSLTQFSFPIGAGFRYHVDKNVIISFEVVPRITMTDYLDDVSNLYPDIETLRELRGDVAAELSYQGDRDPVLVSGTRRGNPSENDWYITSTITFTYRLDPEFTISKKHKFAGYYHCPFEK